MKGDPDFFKGAKALRQGEVATARACFENSFSKRGNRTSAYKAAVLYKVVGPDQNDDRALQYFYEALQTNSGR